MNEIILATNNPNKVKELGEKLAKFGIKLYSQSEAGFNIEVEETGTTLEENSYLKAKAIYDLSKKPVIADDSGLFVDALDGGPGVYSARFAEDDKKRREKLLNLMQNVSEESRTAHFETVICFIDECGKEHYFKGRVDGTIGFEEVGTNGFGFDPLFIYEGKTFAERTREEKSLVSHRGKAISAFVDFISK
jgi:XTP/dITP diphosphohydrolase